MLCCAALVVLCCSACCHAGHQLPLAACRWILHRLAAAANIPLSTLPHADFDGSLPRAALRSILPEDLRAPSPRNDGTGERPLPLGFRLIVAVNKADLLPKQVTPARLEVRKMR